MSRSHLDRIDILDRNQTAIAHDHISKDGIDILDGAGDGFVGAAVLAGILDKVSDGDMRVRGLGQIEILELVVQLGDHGFVRFDAPVGQAFRLADRLLIAGECCKGCKLSGAVQHRRYRIFHHIRKRISPGTKR